MTKMKIAYVVLHYNNAVVTTKCLNYLLNIMGDNSAAVVVDNYSQNDSLNEIKIAIGNNNKIYYISNSQNLGFARGNNLGYQYAREKLDADCIIVMNNDIFIKDYEFENKLCSDCRGNKYSIIAPDVVTLSEKHQNPFRYERIRTFKLFKSMISQYAYAFLFRLGFMIPGVVKKYHNTAGVGNVKVCECIENIVPHGSCVIFTPNYIRKESFAFVPATFFYGEEDLLYDYAAYRNHKTVYVPNIQVVHAEKQSTKSVSKSERTVLQFRAINKAKSLRICLKYRIFPGKFEKIIEKTSN